MVGTLMGAFWLINFNDLNIHAHFFKKLTSPVSFRQKLSQLQVHLRLHGPEPASIPPMSGLLGQQIDALLQHYLHPP